MKLSLLPAPPSSVRVFTARPSLLSPVDGRLWVLQRAGRWDGQPDGLLLWKEYVRESFEVPPMVLTGDLDACCGHLQKLRDSCPSDGPVGVAWEPRRPSRSWRGGVVRLAPGTSVAGVSDEPSRLRASRQREMPPLGKDGDVVLALRWVVLADDVPVGPFESRDRRAEPSPHPRPSFEFALREFYASELKRFDKASAATK